MTKVQSPFATTKSRRPAQWRFAPKLIIEAREKLVEKTVTDALIHNYKDKEIMVKNKRNFNAGKTDCS
jgi:hypothetical protein